MRRLILYTVIVSLAATRVQADINDWVAPLYVTSSSTSAADQAQAARQRIIEAGVWSAAKGPWSVTDSSLRPPSGDEHDYLSWAPYWWPDCNWCSSGGTAQSDGSEGGDPEAPGGLEDQGPVIVGQLPLGQAPVVPYIPAVGGRTSDPVAKATALPGDLESTSLSTPLPYYWASLLLPKTKSGTLPSPVAAAAATAGAYMAGNPPSGFNILGRDIQAAMEEDSVPTATQPGLVARGACTPSRTKMAPSATWTTCAYKQRDGKLNPDVRTLNNTKDVVSMAQSVLWNGVAFGLTNDTSYSRRTSRLITSWFLDSRTGVNAKLSYGQVIRGPGDQMGGYIGILDWRMLVKVVNAVVILRNANADAWSTVMAAGMARWANDYVDWLTSSTEGKRAAKVANNHATFYYNQLIALYILLGDLERAQSAVNTFFTTTFMKQIAEDGEQPLEAVRTRPFHYRCFNLEALIVNAKLADNLALNMWSAKTRDGATIQTAVDYMLTLDPGAEDVTELAPHVAAVAAAYGDPQGKYAAWLADENNSGDPDALQSWRFYNQPEAFFSNPRNGHTVSAQKFAS